MKRASDLSLAIGWLFVDAGLLPIIETIAPKLTDMLHDVVVLAEATQMPADRLALAWRC
jgi:hypothetical protein